MLWKLIVSSVSPLSDVDAWRALVFPFLTFVIEAQTGRMAE
jgi:hypothetical protein